jgi:HSP20 family protein
MKALTPWTGMSSLKKELDRLFDRVWEGDFPDWPSFGEWSPKLDVTDTKDALVVKAEVPGIDPKEIEVTLQEQVLSIKGEKKEEKEEKDERRYRAERSYGALARAIRLPVPVETGGRREPAPGLPVRGDESRETKRQADEEAEPDVTQWRRESWRSRQLGRGDGTPSRDDVDADWQWAAASGDEAGASPRRTGRGSRGRQLSYRLWPSPIPGGASRTETSPTCQAGITISNRSQGIAVQVSVVACRTTG